VERRTTTRCCSALALIALVGWQVKADPKPSPSLPFFPERVLWTLALNNSLAAPPAFSQDAGFFPIEGDRLVAYDLISGKQKWLVPSATKFQPATGDGLVFTFETGRLLARRQSDGAEIWHQELTDSLTAPLTWDNQWLIAADSSGALRAFRARDGHLVWKTEIKSQAHARPALAADRVYVSTTDDRIVALSVETGAVLWEHRLEDTPNEILALDDRIYVGAQDNFLYCLKTDHGELDWRWRTGGDVIGQPAVGGDRVYFVSLDNVLRALNRKSGVQLWKRVLPFRPIAGPVLVTDALVVTGLTSPLHSFATKDGAPVRDIATEGEMAAPPQLAPQSEQGIPLLLAATRDIVKGVTVTAVTRSIEPPPGPMPSIPSAAFEVPRTPPARK